MRICLAVIGLAALAACEQPAALRGAPEVRIATEAEVFDCTPTKIYTTTLGVSGSLTGPRTLELARNQTLANAEADGANTVYFESGGPNDPEALLVRARGYIC